MCGWKCTCLCLCIDASSHHKRACIPSFTLWADCMVSDLTHIWASNSLLTVHWEWSYSDQCVRVLWIVYKYCDAVHRRMLYKCTRQSDEKCQELHLSAVCSHRIRSLTSISHHVSAHFQGCLGRYEASRPFLRVSVVFMAATRRMCRMSKKVEELCQGLGWGETSRRKTCRKDNTDGDVFDVAVSDCQCLPTR